MIDHHLQRQILDKLVTAKSARFADLKPKNIEGNIFTYHLQQLIKQKYVCKQSDGTYCLTADGKAVGINIGLTNRESLRQAHSTLLMGLHCPDKGWLLRRRLVHPSYGKVGFVHTEPVFEETVTATAERVFAERTGLTANFSVKGSAYIRLESDGEIESFTHSTFLLATTYSGELIEQDRSGENFWIKEPDFAADDMIASMQPLIDALNNDNLFFLDLTLDTD